MTSLNAINRGAQGEVMSDIGLAEEFASLVSNMSDKVFAEFMLAAIADLEMQGAPCPTILVDGQVAIAETPGATHSPSGFAQL